MSCELIDVPLTLLPSAVPPQGWFENVGERLRESLRAIVGL